MGKILIWKDNNTPPTNYIWIKQNAYGQTEGIFEHDGNKWVRIGGGGGTGDGVPVTNEPNKIYATNSEGNQTTLNFSINPLPNTLVMRTSYGTIRTETPQDSKDAVPLELFSWIEA